MGSLNPQYQLEYTLSAWICIGYALSGDTHFDAVENKTFWGWGRGMQLVRIVYSPYTDVCLILLHAESVEWTAPLGLYTIDHKTGSKQEVVGQLGNSSK